MSKAKTTSRKKTTRPTAVEKRRRKRFAKREHPVVAERGRTKYVLVPVDEYDRLIAASMVPSALVKLEDPNTKWYDADEVFLQFAGDEIAAARKAAGLTQTQLAKKLGVPQSQISRIERNPDRTTVRTLKKIAKALGVDVSALVR